ncbi:MAG: 1-deoxy-D-xylulose-5-phosphate reductoisomerase [Bacteroidetes bacterium CG2_30_33_31]|nr:MAG: 1-deoxy-D-xylulose-5-phosphate reductoisomerase [Bacteroidetes bacterium CG2_30_33_31]
MKKRIAILGSTGSIGTQTLEVIREHKEIFIVEVLTACKNANLLIQQSIEFQPNAVVIEDESQYKKVADALSKSDIKVYAGKKAIEQIVEMETIDLIMMAIVGFAALPPTIRAIEFGKNIAIANKETFVVAGEFMVEKSKKYKAKVIPVDSEHSAIFQCLAGEFENPIDKIILTASGGPFIGKNKEYLQNVTVAQALNHPNWSMGKKISIDSATLMNKGFEMIEAKWLFGVQPHQVEVVIHPQSIIHSLVQFEDGSIKAQLGLPDMKVPIQYAMTYPFRIKNSFPKFDFAQYPSLNFEKADTNIFRTLAIANEAMIKGGNMPCVINAANEIAVEAFLNERISFLQISEIIEAAMAKIEFIKSPSLQDYFLTDELTRQKVLEQIK